MKHNSKLKRIKKYKIWRKETNNGIEKKNNETFQSEGFFDGSWRLEKNTKLEMRKGTKNQEKRGNNKHFPERKRNKTNMCSKKKENKEKHKENKMRKGKEKKN